MKADDEDQYENTINQGFSTIYGTGQHLQCVTRSTRATHRIQYVTSDLDRQREDDSPC